MRNIYGLAVCSSLLVLPLAGCSGNLTPMQTTFVTSAADLGLSIAEQSVAKYAATPGANQLEVAAVNALLASAQSAVNTWQNGGTGNAALQSAAATAVSNVLIYLAAHPIKV